MKTETTSPENKMLHGKSYTHEEILLLIGHLSSHKIDRKNVFNDY